LPCLLRGGFLPFVSPLFVMASEMHVLIVGAGMQLESWSLK
jgi:hypothetical protein